MKPTRERGSPGILLVANYSNRTGYAWNNIYLLFQHIALACKNWGISPLVSFARFEPPLDWKHAAAFDGVLELPPVPRRPRDLRKWIKAIRTQGVRYLYLTDQAGWDFRYALFRLAGIRTIIVHNRVSVPDPVPMVPELGIRGALKWLACRIPFIQATRVYAVSDFVRDRLVVKARMPSDRVVTILNGVDLERFAPCRQGERNGPVQIFCGSRATVHKGIQVLIEATALLRHQYDLDDFTVLFAGDGPDLPALIDMVWHRELSGLFKFLGELPTTESLIQAADIVVVPSIWGDACPSAVSEALASGKPLVATRVGGVPELVGNEGAAIMVEPGDTAGLAEALARLIKNPDERRGLEIRGRRRAERVLDQRRYHAEVLSQLAQDIGVKLYPQDEVGAMALPLQPHVERHQQPHE